MGLGIGKSWQGMGKLNCAKMGNHTNIVIRDFMLQIFWWLDLLITLPFSFFCTFVFKSAFTAGFIIFICYLFCVFICNPITLARDLKVFVEGGYEIEKMKLMDMFPRTVHVECVVLMSRV